MIDTPLKILVLTSTLPAQPGDGTPEFVLTLSLKLSHRAVVKILAPRVESGVNRIGAVEVVRFPYFPERFESLASDAILPELKRHPWKMVEAVALVVTFMWNAVRYCRLFHPSVIHAHWLIPGGLAAWLASIVTKTPYIITVHGADAYALTGSFARWLRRVVTRRAHHVIPVSRDIATVLGIDPDTALPMGIDVDNLPPGSEPRRRVSGHFVFVGRLAEKKGLAIALEALPKVPDARLTVVGDGPERESLEHLANELDVTDRVQFKGAQPNRRALELLQTANAALIPSVTAASGDQDGTPVVLAEALALCTPVIASRLGGIQDVIDESLATLVSPGDPEELAAAMRFAIDHQDSVEKRAGIARAQALGRLDVSNTASEYMRIFEEIGTA